MSNLNDKEPTDSMKEAAEIFSKHNRAVKMPDTDTTTFRHMYYNFCYWLDDNNPFTKYVYVKSAAEYMDMPRSKRTYLYFWYLDAIINDTKTLLGRKSERDAIDNFHEYNFPVQYWLRENGFSLKCKIGRAYDWLRYKLNPRQKWLKKQIPDDWSDKVWLITELNFAMVVHFVEGEKCFDHTDYENSGENHVQFANDLKDCYDYIKNRRPALQKQHDASYPDEETTTGVYAVDYAELNRLEVLINKEDTKYLVWIVINRDFFWT